MKILKLLVLLVFTSCGIIKNVIQKPTAKIIEVKINSVSFEKIILDAYIEIDNPNGIGIELTNLKYDLIVKGKNIINGLKEEKLKINSKSKDTLRIPVTINVPNFLRTMGESYRDSEIVYEIKISPTLKVPVLGDINIPLSFDGKIPLPRVPSIGIKGINIKKTTLTEIEMLMKLSIKGDGGMNLYIENINYSLLVNNKEWASSKIKDRIYISGKQEQILEVPIKLSIYNIGKFYLQDILKDKFRVDTKFDGSYTIGSEDYNFIKSEYNSFQNEENISIKKD